MSAIGLAVEVEEKENPQPAWALDWASIPSSLNLKLLHWLLESQHQGLTLAKGKDLILFLGLSGAGKSTTVNYLKGNKMQLGMTETGEKCLQLLSDQNPEDCASMGDTCESETLSPNLIPFSGNQFFSDCPGFEDNRGEEYKVCAKITTQSVIKWSASVKAAVVVIKHADIAGKASGFQRLVMELRQVFNDLNAVSPSVLFLVNKAPSHLKEQHVIKAIENIKAASEKQLKSQAGFFAVQRKAQGPESADAAVNSRRAQLAELEAQITFFDLMLAHQNNIMLVDPLDEGVSRQNILGRLHQFRNIDLQQFNLPKHNDDHNEFNKLATLLFESGIDFLSRFQSTRRQIQRLELEEQQAKERLPEERSRYSEAETGKNKSLLQISQDTVLAEINKLTAQSDQLTREIKLIEPERQKLTAELRGLDKEDLVTHWEPESPARVPSSTWYAFLLGGASVLATCAAGASGGILAGAAVGVGAAGSALFIMAKKIVTPIALRYRGIPFPRADIRFIQDPPRGWFDLIEDKPREGIYSADFYGNPFYDCEVEVKIDVPKKEIPLNARRIQQIPEELAGLKEQEKHLTAKREAYGNQLEQLDVKREELQSRMDALSQGQALPQDLDSPEEWEERRSELKTVVSKTEEKIRELEEELMRLAFELHSLWQEIKTRWSFMGFLATVSAFTDPAIPQGPRFNLLYTSERKSFDPSPLPAANYSPPPYEAETKDDAPVSEEAARKEFYQLVLPSFAPLRSMSLLPPFAAALPLPLPGESLKLSSVAAAPTGRPMAHKET